MARTIKLLLVENVDSLGIVGDIVNVRAGYARNYLLPFGYATEPSDELITQLADKRKTAEEEQRKLRVHREALVKKLEGVEITMERSCNDQGLLYGSVTQQDIAAALDSLGFGVKPREVRLPQVIKRLGQFEVTVKLATDLEEHIQVHVAPDRELDLDDREEMEFDNEGNLIEKPTEPAASAADSAKQSAEAQPETPADATA
ncbi:MAG: 50S ribosomal protein L9 [Planctomycetota bacterium]